MNIPNYIGKEPAEIARFDSFDSGNYIYRAMAWLDYHKRTNIFSSLLYACIEARQGIEYLLFEELVISTGANLSADDYKKCVSERNRFAKTIKQLSPDYEKLQLFTQILVSLDPTLPKLIYWNHSNLMHAWGEVSTYLHWFGARSLTSEDPKWLSLATAKVEKVLKPIWEKLTSGQSGLMHSTDMSPIVREVWEQFRIGSIDRDAAKFRLIFLKPFA